MALKIPTKSRLYFLLILVVCAAAIFGIAGKRGTLSRKTPLYVFPDMRRQLKLRPQEANGFFANGISSQLPRQERLRAASRLKPPMARFIRMRIHRFIRAASWEPRITSKTIRCR